MESNHSRSYRCAKHSSIRVTDAYKRFARVQKPKSEKCCETDMAAARPPQPETISRTWSILTVFKPQTGLSVTSITSPLKLVTTTLFIADKARPDFLKQLTQSYRTCLSVLHALDSDIHSVPIGTCLLECACFKRQVRITESDESMGISPTALACFELI